MAAERSAERLPPANLDAEQAVLGACLVDRDTIIGLAPVLDAEDFSRHAHVLIYQAIVRLYRARQPADVLMVADELRRHEALDDAGGETYLGELMAFVGTSVHALYYAELVRAASTRRRLIHSAQQIARAAWDERTELADVVARCELALAGAITHTQRDGYRAMSDVVAGVYDSIGLPRTAPLALGFQALDQLLGGLRRGQLVLVAARPSVGKSALAIQAAAQLARRGVPVGMVSLEMTEEEIVDRMVGFTAGVNMHPVRAGAEPTAEQLTRIATALGKIGNWPLYLDHRPGFTLSEVMSRARALYAETGIRVLMVDYLGLIQVPRQRERGNRTQEVGEIVHALKALARELDITVVALSQLSRAIETRRPPTPQLSDLRDSGDLEQDADVVLFIHRPDRYDETAEAGLAELIVAKHRGGPTGVVRMQFDAEHTQFIDWRWV